MIELLLEDFQKLNKYFQLIESIGEVLEFFNEAELEKDASIKIANNAAIINIKMPDTRKNKRSKDLIIKIEGNELST